MIIKVCRGEFNFEVPISLSSAFDGYIAAGASAFSFVLDELVVHLLNRGKKSDALKDEVREEAMLRARDKGRKDAKDQQALMRNAAAKRMRDMRQET